jgi:hypothetical protein
MWRDYGYIYCVFSRVLCGYIRNFTDGCRGPQERKRERRNSSPGTAPNEANGPFLELELKAFGLCTIRFYIILTNQKYFYANGFLMNF